MSEEAKIFAGGMFCPGDSELKAIKLRSHKLCHEYSLTYEDETERRAELLREIVGELGEGRVHAGTDLFPLRRTY